MIVRTHDLRHRRVSARLRVFAAVAGVALTLLACWGLLAAAGSPATFGLVSVLGILLVIPGDLVRRSLVPRWRCSLGVVAAIDIVGSMTVLVVVGLALAVVGAFRVESLVLALGLSCAAFAVVAWRRRGLDAIDQTLWLLAVLTVLGTVGPLLYMVKPAGLDRILLGQLDTVVALVRDARIPVDDRSFGAATAFPTHYLFYDSILGSLLALGGSTTDWHTMAVVLRVPTLAWFGLGMALAGSEFLRVVFRPSVDVGRRRSLPGLLAVALPVLVFLSIPIQAKLRGPLAEGVSLGLIGFAVASAIAMDSPSSRIRRRWAVACGTALGLIAGVHLPAAIAAALLAGSWIVLAVARRLGESVPAIDAGRGLAARARRATAGIWPAPALALVGLVAWDLAGGGTLVRLVGGAVRRVEDDSANAFRALMLLSAEPWSTVTPSEYLAQYLEPSYMFVGARWQPGALLFVAIGAATVVLAGQRIRAWPIVWVASATSLTLAYGYVGPMLGAAEITPWNAVMRNAFYVWLPLSFLALIGIAGMPVALMRFSWRRSPRAAQWLALGVAGLLLVPVAVPLARNQLAELRSYGWLAAGQSSKPGEAALRWLAEHTEADARIITPEITYGSGLWGDRDIVTDGKGTLESPAVTRPAILALEGAGRFFLPVRDPSVLRDFGIDYVVSYRSGIYADPQFGGIPLLRDAGPELAAAAEATPLGGLGYLDEVYRDGEIAIYAVEDDALPTVERRMLTDSIILPDCRADICFDEFPSTAGCSAETTSIVPGICTKRRVDDESPSTPGIVVPVRGSPGAVRPHVAAAS